MLDYQNLVIATKHGKEAVIQPFFSVYNDIKFIVPPEIDTDLFGTFSGERIRPGSPLEVLRMKCLLGLKITGQQWAVASEGSFAPHPEFPFVSVNEEWAMIYHAPTNLEIYTRNVYTRTNFAATTVQHWDELIAFAQKTLFPEHALILGPQKDFYDPVFKGIQSFEALEAAFSQLKINFESIYVETDMRAHLNPTRMKNIGETFRQLLDKFRNHCPSCNHPGFAVQKLLTGLPCEWCGLPTRLPLKKIYHCEKCNHQSENIFPEAKEFADPMHCSNCNP